MMRRDCVTLVPVLVVVLLCPDAGAAPQPPLATKLERAAKKAIFRAAVLLRGAWEIARDQSTLLQLARAQTMTGQIHQAVESYRRLLAMNPPKPVAQLARAEVQRLEHLPIPASHEWLLRVRATAEAKQAYAHGMKLAKRNDPKTLVQATRYLRAALVLDPELPGTYRILVAVYDKLKDPAKKQSFMLDYLRIRPDGSTADAVRRRLKPTGVLGALTLTASFPCKIWVNGRPLGKTTPVKDLLLPPGRHEIMFDDLDKHHAAKSNQIWLGKGYKTTVDFPYGVLKTQLKPRALVRVGRRSHGQWSTIGLPVGRYSVELTTQDNSRRKTLDVEIQAGKTVTISSW